jgi:eukaryotic-like serine/threonine-protein kinase
MVPIVPGLPTGVREGEIVAGKYRIVRVLGAGAMGTVALARHLNLDQDVAIKFLTPEALGTDAVGRLLREARAVARIRSEHVVRVHDVSVLESGVPYIEMEYLEGCDLSKWLQKYGPLDVELAVDFLLQACDAIAEAHQLQVIHRDVKPANLFAVQRMGVVETIKVLDFGISKAGGLVSATLPPGEWPSSAVDTQEKMPIGSPCYMSPEQMESARDVDPRTDIWALGVTLSELLTGRLPFEGQSLLQVWSKITSETPPCLRDSAPHVPPGLEAVILKCLKPRRDERYGSVTELARALVEFGSSRAAAYVLRMVRAEGHSEPAAESPRTVTPSPRVLAPRGAEKTLASPVSGAVAPASRRGPNVAVAWGLGLLLLVAAAAVFTVVSKRVSSEASRWVPPSPVGQVVSVVSPETGATRAELTAAPVGSGEVGGAATAASARPAVAKREGPSEPAPRPSGPLRAPPRPQSSSQVDARAAGSAVPPSPEPWSPPPDSH